MGYYTFYVAAVALFPFVFVLVLIIADALPFRGEVVLYADGVDAGDANPLRILPLYVFLFSRRETKSLIALLLLLLSIVL